MNQKNDNKQSVDATQTKTRAFFSELARKTKMKSAYIFIGIVILVFFGAVGFSVFDKFQKYDPDAKKKEELKSREILVDNSVMFQSIATNRISTLEGGVDNLKKEMKDLTVKQGEVFKKINDSLDKLAKETKDFKEGVKKEIKEEIGREAVKITTAVNEQKKQTDKLFTSMSDTQKQLENLRSQNADLEKKLQDVEKKRAEDAQNIKMLSVPSDDQKSLPHPKDVKQGNSKDKSKDKGKGSEYDVNLSDNPTVISGGNEVYDADTYGIQIVMNEGTMSYNGVSQSASSAEKKQQPQKKKQDDFTVPVGVAEGVLFTGGEAKISGFGENDDENTPVGIKLLSDMTIANGNYKQVEDCFLIGSAKGELGSNRAIIRLYKISCLFQDEKSDLYIAEGNVKGWVFDENSSLGVSGRLISKEGQIIMTSLPLTLLQAGMDYLTKSATNINILGSADVSSALSSGLSNGANQSFEKLQKIYEKYLDALTPAISFRAGRKISILFEGGQTIPLRLFKKNKNASTQSLRGTVDFMLSQENKSLMEQIIEE